MDLAGDARDATLTNAQQEQAKKLAGEIDLLDGQAAIQYGIGAQRRVSTFADTILRQVHASDSSSAAAALDELMASLSDLGIAALERGGSRGDRLFGRAKRRLDRFLENYGSVSGRIDRIAHELEAARMSLLKDIAMLEHLHKKNSEYLSELDVYIAAGVSAVAAFRTQKLRQLDAASGAGNDPLALQRLNDAHHAVDRFDKKLHDMRISRMVAIQMAPQIRLVQGNSQLLVEKIQSSVLNTIPLWRNQAMIAVSLLRQQGVLALQRRVSERAGKVLRDNATTLKSHAHDATDAGRGDVDELANLARVNRDLVATVHEALAIHRDGRTRRAAAEVELRRVEEELRGTLGSLSGST